MYYANKTVLDSNSKFQQLLADDGLKMVSTQADGNCMFVAIASQLNYVGIKCNHMEVRSCTIQFIRGILCKQELVSIFC